MTDKSRFSQFPVHAFWAAYGCFFIFSLFGRGIFKECLYLTGSVLIWQMIVRPELLSRLRIFWPLALVGVLIAVTGGAMASPDYDRSYQYLILQFYLAVCCTYLLPAWPYGRLISLDAMLIVTLGAFILAQGVGDYISKLDTGLYENIHYLGLSTALVLPLLAFLYWRSKSLGKLFCALVLGADLLLLLKSGSRPAWVAIVMGCIVVIPLLEWRNAFFAAFCIIVFPMLLYFSGFFGVDRRIETLVARFSEEERHSLWSNTLRMQFRSDHLQWFFGHGFGRFYDDFKQYSNLRSIGDFIFPHNFFLEILYSNGVLGLMTVVAGYGYFLFLLFRLPGRASAPLQKVLAITLASTTVIHLVQTFLTMPFFSKYTLIYLGIFVGAGARLFEMIYGGESAQLESGSKSRARCFVGPT